MLIIIVYNTQQYLYLYLHVGVQVLFWLVYGHVRGQTSQILKVSVSIWRF